ncbi:hypothetical protein IID24_04555 [Patescibacteria group bacterium]|nr:hypothetical protein [Patescibacteria group bacterium]
MNLKTFIGSVYLAIAIILGVISPAACLVLCLSHSKYPYSVVLPLVGIGLLSAIIALTIWRTERFGYTLGLIASLVGLMAIYADYIIFGLFPPIIFLLLLSLLGLIRGRQH